MTYVDAGPNRSWSRSVCSDLSIHIASHQRTDRLMKMEQFSEMTYGAMIAICFHRHLCFIKVDARRMFVCAR